MPACGGEVRTTTADPIPFALAAWDGESLGAGLAGSFAIEGSCAYVTQAETGRRYLLVLPAGETGWDGTSLSVFGVPLEPDAQALLGGYGRENRPDGVALVEPGVVQSPAPECDDTDIWFVHSARAPAGTVDSDASDS